MGANLKDKLKLGPVWALGTMSGTSLDGADAAMVLTDGVSISEFGPSQYRAYSADEADVIRTAFGAWHTDDGVAAAAEVVETAHAEVLSTFSGADVIGFHGQTLAHDPDNRRTHQTGDGRILAGVLETPVVWDFRSTDVELGGQGAPLAPFFHWACARFIGATTPVAFLNLGGVGNITWVDPRYDTPDADGALLAFDTGPANAPINDMMARRLGVPFDENGALAAQGTVAQGALEEFLDHPYFFKVPPKSLDRDDFSHLAMVVDSMDDEDAAATLTGAVAASVMRAMEHCPMPPETVYVTGGGRKNATLMGMLAAAIDGRVVPVEDAGLDGDMLEAQAFAYLAVRVARGLSTSAPNTTGVGAPVGGGVLSV